MILRLITDQKNFLPNIEMLFKEKKGRKKERQKDRKKVRKKERKKKRIF